MNRSNPSQLSCYLGCITREKSEAYLFGRKPGTYLIRDSRSIPGDFVLSVSEKGKERNVSHYIINNKGSHYQIGDNTFQDLPGIIEFYKNHFLDSTNLIQPIFKVQAQYPFSGKDEEDLSFKKNDILIVVEQNEEKWWTAMDDLGNRGLIPEPYVKKVTELQQAPAGAPVPVTAPAQAATPVQASPQQVPSDSRRSMPPPASSAASPDNSNSRRTSVPSNLRSHPVQVNSSNSDNSFLCVAIRQHVLPYDESKLSFEKGDIIKVLKKYDNGIWFGQNGERTGYFQFRYVQKLEDENPD
ncbi:unnamed protein product [Porites lobata]|uniref:Adapter molecule Crk n=1 Tax=Porites lobata TaxID=104759 RepID=A0ABN8NA14_9CNID|nr:unnamed protein product [Porites lobata]